MQIQLPSAPLDVQISTYLTIINSTGNQMIVFRKDTLQYFSVYLDNTQGTS
jgi:hypothetical protein